MADNDYNIIKPVETLQNVESLAPAKYRQGKKKQQSLHEQNDQRRKLVENELKESTEKDIGSKINENDRDRHSIDYRA